jgi:hypothetical protein
MIRIAPPEVRFAPALDLMAGPRGHVLLAGQGHELDPGSGADIVTWSLAFLAAWVNNDAAARSKLLQVDHVEGGLDDHKALYIDPSGGSAAGEIVDTIEYYNAALDHYFITRVCRRGRLARRRVPVAGWTRTGIASAAEVVGTGRRGTRPVASSAHRSADTN